MTSEELVAVKKRFAAMLLKEPAEPFKAALAAGLDTGQALRASVEWINDSIVLEEKKRLIEEQENGELDFLPTKAEAARLAWNIANSATFVEDKLKALKLYADMRGFIPKVEAVKIDNSVTHNKVMIVKDQGTDEEWEAKARMQQRKLVEEASGNVASKH